MTNNKSEFPLPHGEVMIYVTLLLLAKIRITRQHVIQTQREEHGQLCPS
jgi:hypothetical protein